MGSNGGNELAFASAYNSSKIRCSKVSLMKILYSKYKVFQNTPISIASSRIDIYITQELTGKNLKAHKIKHLKSQANGIL